jgi:hypothetical protein
MGYRQTARVRPSSSRWRVAAIVAGPAGRRGLEHLAGQRGRADRHRRARQLFIHGFQVDNPIEIWTGIVVTVALALPSTC